MIYTREIQKAIRFAIKTHEVYQKQKRKGKDIPYLTHPLTVGLILARAGADEDVIVAGILHDTIEDSVDEKKVTREMLANRFGDRVADLVDSVTEQDKTLSWEERKAEALAHIESFSHESVLVKSADVLSNLSELVEDHEREGDGTWSRFNATKEQVLENAGKVVSALQERWPESPLAADLAEIEIKLSHNPNKNYPAPLKKPTEPRLSHKGLTLEQEEARSRKLAQDLCDNLSRNVMAEADTASKKTTQDFPTVHSKLADLLSEESSVYGD